MAIASAKGGFTTPLVSFIRWHSSHLASHLYQEESSRPFEAYVNNGGTAVALRGPTYSIVAADTRLSTGYSIHTRDCSRVSQLTSQCAIATSGMHADTVALHKNLKSGIRSSSCRFSCNHISAGMLSKCMNTTTGRKCPSMQSPSCCLRCWSFSLAPLFVCVHNS
jgi:20S proteasome alpha/beta subunit